MNTSRRGKAGRMSPHQLGISSAVQDDVLGFEISVNNSPRVQESQSLYDAAGVEPSGAVVERPPGRHKAGAEDLMVLQDLKIQTHTYDHAPISQERPQLSTEASLHQHVEIFGVSEGPIQSAGRQKRICLRVVEESKRLISVA